MSSVTTGTFEGLIRSLDSDPLRRGKQFEKITKWWLQNDPIHSRDVKKVWLWDEWPDRPGRDIGVDLVAEMRDGSLCAIQSKCFDMGRDIPKSELDSFVSAASTRTFKHRWLVASTDGLSANARRMLRDNHVTQILFSYLDSLEGFWPSSFDALGGTPRVVKASPRPHQQDAIRDVVEGLSKVPRGQLIMACGTGKTLTALWITEALEPSTTLVLVPSLSLLSQTLSEWAKNANSKWDYLCVCSDETVNKSDDAPISTTDDLPFDVTTKPADIAAFLERRGRKIIFSTYQSSAQVAKAQKTAGKKFDLVICDEAHRLTGKNDAEFATALDNSKIPAKKRLFMTATPRTYTASVKAKASERGVEITSMDDETVFGKELHKLSFGQAIEKELLTDYRVVIVGVTDPQVQELIDQRELVSVAGTIETDARTLAAHIGLAKATKDYDLKRTISFHGRIKTAQQFAQQHASIVEWMPENHKPSGTIWADTITGAMNSSERRKLLNKLKAEVPGQHALLSNARCLTEGVDVPSLDGVAFIDPRSSQVDIVQAVGRAIRKAESKSLGTIVLPVLIPHNADLEHAMQDSAFKPIWGILNALKSHDEDLAKQTSELRTQMGSTGSIGPMPEKIIADFPADIEQMIPGFVEKFTVSIIEHSTTSWDWWYGFLKNYSTSSGTSLIRSDEIVDGKRIGSWIVNQRHRFKSKQLTENQVAMLEALPNWSWDPVSDQWGDDYSILVAYMNKFGHCSPSKDEVFGGHPLGSWVSTQRTRFKRGSMIPHEIERLESIGFKWSINAGHGEFFERFISHLETWVKEGGDPNPGQNLESDARIMADGYRIADQAIQARRALAGGVKNVRATDDEIHRLKELGFSNQILRIKRISDIPNAFRCIDFSNPITTSTLNRVSIDDIAVSSRSKVGCKCPDCGHAWTTPIRFLTNAMIPCPQCRERAPKKSEIENSLALHPNWRFISEYWDYETNNSLELFPDRVSQGTHRRIANLVCPDCGHKWQRKIAVLRRSFSCPKCQLQGIRFRQSAIDEICSLASHGTEATQIAKRFGVLPSVLKKVLEIDN